jgi:hypothetical protein
VLVGTALCATLPSITAAHAATTAPTVALTVNGQTPNGTTPLTVSGVMNVTATITAAPNNPVETVRFSMFNSSFFHVVTLQPGQCDTTCTVQASFDTSTVQGYATGGVGTPTTADGFHNLQVTAMDASYPYGSAGASIQVDNHRPTAGVGAGTYPTLTATKTLTWTLTPAVSPTAPAGTTISDIELEAPGTSLPVSHFTKNADGSWTLTADTSSVNGAYAIAAVATDSNGTISNPQHAELIADNGFTLTTPSATQLNPTGWGGLQLGYSYPNNWAGCNNTYIAGKTLGPTNVELQVDGKVWQDSPVRPGVPLPVDSSGHCELPAVGNTGVAANPLPVGKHTLTWVVTDTYGVQESATESVMVGMPLTSNWPTGPMFPVAGSTLRLNPVVSSPDGVSTLQSWSITDQTGKTLASGTGATAPSLTLATPATAETSGTLTLNLVSDQGLSSSQSFSYQTGWQTGAFAHVSATSVKAGTWVKLSSDIWERVAGTWKENPGYIGTVQYQWSTAGSGVWHNTSLVHVGGAQPAVPPTAWSLVSSNVCYRVVYTEANYWMLPATSAPVCVTVKP